MKRAEPSINMCEGNCGDCDKIKDGHEHLYGVCVRNSGIAWPIWDWGKVDPYYIEHVTICCIHNKDRGLKVMWDEATERPASYKEYLDNRWNMALKHECHIRDLIWLKRKVPFVYGNYILQIDDHIVDIISGLRMTAESNIKAMCRDWLKDIELAKSPIF